MSSFPLLLYNHEGVDVTVTLDNETLRLNQDQLSQIFAIERSVITKHIRNIIKEGELSQEGVCAFFAHTGSDGKTYQVQFYNLDMIISVGYRVNSKKATQFRKRSTQVLKDHILKGYSLNTIRLEKTGIEQLYDTLDLIKKTLEQGNLNFTESQGLIELMVSYIPSLITLNQYDTNNLPTLTLTNEQLYTIDLQESKDVLIALKQELIDRSEATDLFARPRESGLESIIGAIYQSFGEHDVYPSVEEKAANLLYLVIKNHPFIDGNKRSGAFLFVWYLSKNNCLYKSSGSLKISEQTLVALALLVATSTPSEKDLMIQLIVVLLQ